VINAAFAKLSKLMTAQKVYRAPGGTLPGSFWERDEFGVCGGVEFAFMSTTLKHDVAFEYASRSKAGIIFEIHQGLVDRGADLSWLSQYPFESEITFPPCTGLEVKGKRVEGSVMVVELAPSVGGTRSGTGKRGQGIGVFGGLGSGIADVGSGAFDVLSGVGSGGASVFGSAFSLGKKAIGELADTVDDAADRVSSNVKDAVGSKPGSNLFGSNLFGGSSEADGAKPEQAGGSSKGLFGGLPSFS